MHETKLADPPISSGLSWLAMQDRSALINWLLIWVVLANGGFALMHILGSPPRLSSTLVFAIVGLLVRNKPYLIQITAFCAAMTYSVLAFVASLFNLTVVSLIYSLEFLAELDIARSAEYLIGIAILAAIVGLACAMLRMSTNFRSTQALLSALLVVGLAMLTDFAAGQGMRAHYSRVASVDTPFTSAVTESGALSGSKRLERNLLIVMVESLGLPVEHDEMKRLLFARYRSADLSRFEISNGTTTYYSSTTSGEIRELCGRWGEYHELLDIADESCIPARLAAQGISTSAYHSFEGRFFDRSRWYPNIGFKHTYFSDDLIANGAEKCGGVFPGACDRDVPALIADKLKGGNEPQLIYWLTVNSHLPIPHANNLKADECHEISPKLAREFPMICRQFAIWDSIDRMLVKELRNSDFPPTDVLIVGDHMPPYHDSRSRRQFAPDLVPWLFLKWREETLDRSSPASDNET